MTNSATLEPSRYVIRTFDGIRRLSLRRWAADSHGVPARLTDDEAAQRMAAAGLDPIGPYPGYSRRWAAHCHEAGHEVTTTLAQARRWTTLP